MLHIGTNRMPYCVFQRRQTYSVSDGTIDKSLPPSTVEVILGEWPQWDIAKSLVLPLLRIAHVAHMC